MKRIISAAVIGIGLLFLSGEGLNAQRGMRQTPDSLRFKRQGVMMSRFEPAGARQMPCEYCGMAAGRGFRGGFAGEGLGRGQQQGFRRGPDAGRNWRSPGMAGMRSPEMLSALSEQQRKDLFTLRQKQQEELFKLRQDYEAKMQAVREEHRKKVESILSEEQRKRLKGEGTASEN